MHDSRKRFHYSLESLLKKRNFDHDVLQLEQRHARQALDEKVTELDRAMNAVVELEEQIRKAQSGETRIDPARIMGMTMFLDSRRHDVKEKAGQLRQMESIYQQIMEQLRKISQSIKSLEKNKASKQKRFDMMQQHAAHIEMDNLWLTKRNDS